MRAKLNPCSFIVAVSDAADVRFLELWCQEAERSIHAAQLTQEKQSQRGRREEERLNICFCFFSVVYSLMWVKWCFRDALLSNTQSDGQGGGWRAGFAVLSSFLAQAHFRQMVRKVLWKRIPPSYANTNTHTNAHMHKHNNAWRVPQELTVQLWHLSVMKHHSIALKRPRDTEPLMTLETPIYSYSWTLMVL